MNKHEQEHKKVEQNEFDNEENDACECDCSCNCGDDCDCSSEDISTKEIAHHADDKVDALIQLLMKKNLITESEFEESYNSLFEESDEE